MDTPVKMLIVALVSLSQTCVVILGNQEDKWTLNGYVGICNLSHI